MNTAQDRQQAAQQMQSNLIHLPAEQAQEYAIMMKNAQEQQMIAQQMDLGLAPMLAGLMSASVTQQSFAQAVQLPAHQTYLRLTVQLATTGYFAQHLILVRQEFARGLQEIAQAIVYIA
jgi:endoglucanase Acf2